MEEEAIDRLNLTLCEHYASEDRPPFPPEQLLLALLLQASNGICLERLLLERLNYYLLLRWFAGFSPDDPIWYATTFTRHREQLLDEQGTG